MLRSLFRRLPLATSLVVLLSISLFDAMPAQAKSLASMPCNNNTNLHCAVAVTVQSPSGAIGASTYMEVWQPHVDLTSIMSDNDYSIAQLAVLNGSPVAYGLTFTKDIEVGWLVDPAVPPHGYGDNSPHLFVFVRDWWKGGGNANCLVVQNADSSWTCGFGSYPGAAAYPNAPLNVTSGDVKLFVIVYSGGYWFIQYDHTWVGYINESWFTGGTGTFNSVAYAQWQGEVASTSSNPTTQMGNGTCGTKPNSAHFYTMQVATPTQAIDAWTLSSTHRATATNRNLYNGTFSNTTGTQSTLAYGGPTGCP